ncbi:MAG TPA: response regulator [Gemmatimonadaceae bacterium]|jgi:DNA-binding NtrC family response regulator|nr:response regulator [Gemmatimonadaceae bacterium]
MTRRILIVDDEELMVKTLGDIVRLHGWEADAAYSGESAVEAVSSRDYAVVLMDVRMTGINGVEAFKLMKQVRPGIRVILMTAYTATEILAEAEREGALRILSKPVALAGLIDTLKEATTESRCVLVVDDDTAFLKTLRKLLEQNGFSTFTAPNLDAAIEMLENRTPGAVVLDLRLNGITAPETVLAIKHVSPSVALILCSGYPAALDEAASTMSPQLIHATLHKPFPLHALLNILNAVFAD